MSKRTAVITVIAVVAAGVLLQRRINARRAPDAAPTSRPVVAERFDPPPTVSAPSVATEPTPDPAQDQPAHEHPAHILRPSPVPREHPVWTPPVSEPSHGKHEAPEGDE